MNLLKVPFHLRMTISTPSEGNGISRLIQSLGRYYVRYVNQTYGRSGTLWALNVNQPVAFS